MRDAETFPFHEKLTCFLRGRHKNNKHYGVSKKIRIPFASESITTATMSQETVVAGDSGEVSWERIETPNGNTKMPPRDLDDEPQAGEYLRGQDGSLFPEAP